MLPPFRLVDQLRARRHFEEVERNGAATRADHGEAAAPRQCGDRCRERRVHSHAIQDECRPDSAGELANVIRGIRTTRDDVVGAVLASQLQSGFARIDGDDSCARQLAKELNRIESQTADADHDRGAARPDRRKRRLDRGVCRDAGIRERRGLRPGRDRRSERETSPREQGHMARVPRRNRLREREWPSDRGSGSLRRTGTCDSGRSLPTTG